MRDPLAVQEVIMIVIDQDKCTGCGLCCQDCVSSALELRDGKALASAEPCLMCGHCVAICPVDAVSMAGYDKSEVLAYDKETFSISEQALLNTIKFRRSIRSFREGQVEKEKIEKMLEAGRYSPTGSNSQNVSYIVLQDDLAPIRTAANRSFNKLMQLAKKTQKLVKSPINFDRIDLNQGDFLFKGAPTVILVISDSPVNASIASANMELVAIAQGLGMLYVGFFVMVANHSKKIRQMLGLEGKQKIVTCLAVGYPAVHYKRTVPRKKVQVQWR